MRGCSGRSAMSMRRWPLWASRSCARLSRSHRLAKALTAPSAHSMVSAAEEALTFRTANRSGMYRFYRGVGIDHVKDTRTSGRNCADPCEHDENAFPAQGNREARDAVACEHPAKVADAVDDAG